jgi:hypothetical protein
LRTGLAIMELRWELGLDIPHLHQRT